MSPFAAGALRNDFCPHWANCVTRARAPLKAEEPPVPIARNSRGFPLLRNTVKQLYPQNRQAMLATPHSPLDLDSALSLDLRKSKGSPANPRRYLTSSWDEIISGRRGLRSSVNPTAAADDFSMLFESIENPLSARQSPSSGRYANFLNLPPTQPLVCSPTFSRLRASGNHMSLSPASMHTPVAGSLFTLSPASIRRLQQSQQVVAASAPQSAVSLSGSQTVAAPVAIPVITIAPPPVFDSVVVPASFEQAVVPALSENGASSTVVEEVGSVMPAPMVPLAAQPPPVAKSTDSAAAATATTTQVASQEGQSLENKVFNFTPLFFAEPISGSSCVPTPMNFNDYTTNPRASTGGCSPCEIGGPDAQSFNCIKCGKDYSLAVSLGASIGEAEPLNHSPETCKNQKCPYCCKLYNISDSLVKHINRKHNHIKTYRCTFPDCGKTFITRKEQQNHIARHSSEPRYFCEYGGCNCKYTTKSSLDLHITRIHGEKKYKCDLCDERYSVRGDLNQHMKRKHSKQRKSN